MVADVENRTYFVGACTSRPKITGGDARVGTKDMGADKAKDWRPRQSESYMWSLVSAEVCPGFFARPKQLHPLPLDHCAAVTSPVLFGGREVFVVCRSTRAYAHFYIPVIFSVALVVFQVLDSLIPAAATNSDR